MLIEVLARVGSVRRPAARGPKREWHAWGAAAWRKRERRHKRHVRHGEDAALHNRSSEAWKYRHADEQGDGEEGHLGHRSGDAALYHRSSEAWNYRHADEQGDGEEGHLGHRSGDGGSSRRQVAPC